MDRQFSFKAGGGGGGGMTRLNKLESVSTILMCTSVQKMNDSVVQLKEQ